MALCGTGIVNAGAAVVAAQGTVPLPLRNVYLPLSQRNDSGMGGGSVVPNGDFESGRVLWSVNTGVYQDPLIYEKGTTGGLPLWGQPHGGSWAAWLGGYDNASLAANGAYNATIGQTVQVSAGKPYLVYYQMVRSNEANCNADFARVTVNNSVVAGSQIGLCAATTPQSTWVRKSLNLSSYAGQSVNLVFAVQIDTSAQTLESSWLLDDVSFSATP